MRIVRFSSQERVDIPDITAMSYLVLGEFRRTVRGLLTGQTGTGVVRRFDVAPTSTPSSVEVTVNPGSTPLGIAVAGDGTSFGQVMGGQDDNGNTEGNATQTFDFTGQPAGTYSLQARFAYTAGANDNRAFWNATTNTEYIAATNTRQLPVVELGVSLGAGTSLGSEYIPLADIVWDGSTVTANDITDTREFLVEGTAGAFTGATQADNAGPGDFDRSTDRAVDGVNEVYPALRALARQIQDLKGPNTSGTWDWYSRIWAPYSDGGSSLATEQTRHVQALETTTYTVGDGTTTFGDFNSLETCLAHVAALSSPPETVRILLRSNASGGGIWALTNYHDFSAGPVPNLIIEGVGVGSITWGGSSTGIVLDMGAGTGTALTLRNLTFSAPGAGVEWARGEITAENVIITGDTSAAAVPAITANKHSRIRDSSIAGILRLGPSQTTGGRYLVEGCELDVIDASVGASGVGYRVDNAVIRACSINQTTPTAFGANGAVDLSGATRATLEECRINYHPSHDAVYVDVASHSVDPQLRFRGCTFKTSTSPGHNAGAGGNGANGTGWGIYASNGAVALDFRDTIKIEGCTFTGESVDAGGIFLQNIASFAISGCDWIKCDATGASDTYNAITIDNGGVTGTTRGTISGCSAGRWGTANPERVRVIHAVDCAGLVIQGLAVDGDDDAASGPAHALSAVFLDGARNTAISGCTFSNYLGAACVSADDYAAVTGCSFRDSDVGVDIAGEGSCTVSGNSFDEVALAINAVSSDDASITGNAIRLASTAVGIDMTTCVGGIVSGNALLNATIDTTGATSLVTTAGGGALNSIR